MENFSGCSWLELVPLLPWNNGVEMRDLEAYGEPGAIVYWVDCVELMRLMPAGTVDAILADPPYRVSGGGLTVKSGRLVPVDKGEWDRSRRGIRTHHSTYSCSHTTCRGRGTDAPSLRGLTRHPTGRGYVGFWIWTSENSPSPTIGE